MSHYFREVAKVATLRPCIQYGFYRAFIYSIAECVTGQSHNSKSCETQGAIIGVKAITGKCTTRWQTLVYGLSQFFNTTTELLVLWHLSAYYKNTHPHSLCVSKHLMKYSPHSLCVLKHLIKYSPSQPLCQSTS